MISASEALQKLKAGNQRFVSGTGVRDIEAENIRRRELLENQSPFAIVLGCSDSRVPLEMIFDQGLGDLFVIRVAGNIVAPSQVGSIEFCADQFGTKLVVVLGHTGCGAVKASLEALEKPQENQSPNLGFIVNNISPCVKPLLESELRHDREALIAQAVRENIRNTVNRIRSESEILGPLIRERGLLVVGAEYSLQTGEVDFFDGMVHSE